MKDDIPAVLEQTFSLACVGVSSASSSSVISVQALNHVTADWVIVSDWFS